MQEGGTIYAYLIFNNASFPIVPAGMPNASAPVVTDSSGASRVVQSFLHQPHGQQ